VHKVAIKTLITYDWDNNYSVYTVSRRKTGQLMFHHSFGKCEPIYKILQP